MLVIRLVLAAVFAVAAVGKFADRGGSRDALRGFGVPAALTGSLAVLLPAGELTIAAALIVPATAWWGAVAALVLLLSFAAAIAVNLGRGRTPPCHCFGRLHTAPTGPSTLARTGALATLAGAAVARGDADPADDPLGWAAALSRADAVAVGLGLVMLALLTAGAVAFAALIAQNGRLLVRVEALERRLASDPQAQGAGLGDGLPVGAPAPAFAVDDLDGRSTSLDDLRAAGRPIGSCSPTRAAGRARPYARISRPGAASTPARSRSSSSNAVATSQTPMTPRRHRPLSSSARTAPSEARPPSAPSPSLTSCSEPRARIAAEHGAGTSRARRPRTCHPLPAA